MLFFVMLLMEKERNRTCDHFVPISPEIKVCKGMCEADSDCTHASLV